MSNKSLVSLFAGIALLATPAIAFAEEATEPAHNCSRPEAIVVSVDGSTASEAEMEAAKKEVIRYVNLLNDFRTCLDPIIDEAKAAQNEELYGQLTAEYNKSIDDAQAAADAYNSAAKKFKKQQK